MTPMPDGLLLSRRARLFGLSAWALGSLMPARRAAGSARSESIEARLQFGSMIRMRLT